MRGASTPAGLLIAPQINGFNPALNTPYAYDPKKSKELLAEAGYPDGFEVGMDCPNDRYVNDEKVCQAVASMLAKVGVKVDLNAQPKSKYFAKVLATGGFDTSFYLLGLDSGFHRRAQCCSQPDALSGQGQSAWHVQPGQLHQCPR